jgi:transglutaminase-like putative cysteine protease
MTHAALILLTLAQSAPKTVMETWQAAYLQGFKIGHTHTLTVEANRGGEKILRTTRRIELTVKRYGAVLPVTIEQSCDEALTGEVRAMSLRQGLGKDKEMTTSIRIEGKKMWVSSGGGREVEHPWDGGCKGLFAQEQAFAAIKADPGDRFSIRSYELAALLPLTLKVAVKDFEATDRLVMKKGPTGEKALGREPVKLLRAEITTDKVKVGGTEVQLPPKVAWLDDKRQVAREQFEFPGLGMVTQYTAPKELVLFEKVNPALLPDLGLMVMIPLKTTLTRPMDTKEVVYKVTLKEAIDPPFVEDGRQKIKARKGRSFELHVTADREPGTRDDAPSPGKEFTEPSPFLDSGDPAIVAMARKAVGDEKSPYKKALKLEQHVHDAMKFSASTGFPPASRIARDLEGDCRQHSMLLAALLRASGIPSRTALGLVYFREEGRSPQLAFHMWVEAWVGGKWLALDAISGKGGIAAAHLKMSEASWAGTETLAPLLPIAQALGKLEIDIIDSK